MSKLATYQRPDGQAIVLAESDSQPEVGKEQLSGHALKTTYTVKKVFTV
jgi:hypothetical protein